MEIRYFEDKTPRIIYGTLDSVWINKASKCISFYVKEDNGGYCNDTTLYRRQYHLTSLHGNSHYDCDAR